MTRFTGEQTIPPSWVLAALEQIGCWSGGGTPSKSNPRFWHGGSIPWVSPKDMKVARIIDTLDHITASAIDHSPTRVLAPGSVLIVTRSGILRRTLPVAVADVPLTINQDLKALRLHRGFIPEYVLYALMRFEGDILTSCSKDGTTVDSISTPRLQRFEIPIAPEPEQHRIVSAVETQFTRLDSAVESLKRIQANLKRYRASVLKAAVEGRLVPTEAEVARQEGREYEAASVLLERILKERRRRWQGAEFAKMKAKGKVPKDDKWKQKYKDPVQPITAELRHLPQGWTWAVLDQLTLDVRYGTSTKTREHGEVPVLRMGNIQDGRLEFGNLKYLPADHHEFPGLLLSEGDLLFNRTNSPELVGKTAVFGSHAGTCSFASYLIRVRMLPGVLPEYVACYLNSAFGRLWISSVVSQQVGQANVNGTKLKSCYVPLPPLAEQRRIVDRGERLLSHSRDIEAEAARDLRRSERLRQSILKWAFVGKLVDQDPDDEPASVLLERIKAEREAAVAKQAEGQRPRRKVRTR